jgi:D-alanyl-D-alanine carboxypeptidase/D-alanyl-D-alanine-endopeptidase (penicillin-binding protein 4)
MLTTPIMCVAVVVTIIVTVAVPSSQAQPAQAPIAPPATVVQPSAAAISPALPRRIDLVLKGHGLPADSYGFFVQEVGGGMALLEHNALRPFNPASTMKVLTTLTALEQLGPAYTWDTAIYPLGEIRDGTLNGDLLIQGGGDPFLLEEHVRAMLKAVQRSGISRITGDLVLDTSYFDTAVSQEPMIDSQSNRAYNVLPHALMSNFQTVTFYFTPSADGTRVVVNTDPALSNLEISNNLRLSNGPCEGYNRGVRIEDDPANPRAVLLSGNFPSGCREFSLVRAVLDPNEYFFGLFSHLWQELGGEFNGKLRESPPPADLQPLLVWGSPPLAEVIRSINKFSNNLMTRQTLLTLGAEHSASPATLASGADAVTEYLALLGLNSAGLVVSNGAGLSRDASISPALLNAVLQQGYDSRYMPEFLASLPINGIDGTMRTRLRDNKLRGSMHIKTGTLDEVSAVAGYVFASSGKKYTVVGILNHPLADRGPGAELMDALLTWVYEQ